MSVRFTVSRTIDAAPDLVWTVLGDFGTEHRWTETLVHCERDTEEVRVGTSRHCRLPRPLMGRTEVQETLTEYEEGDALTYRLQGPAGPFESASSRWSLEPASESGTTVQVEGVFEPKNALARYVIWPFARLYIKRLTRSVLGELETYLAAGAPEHS